MLVQSFFITVVTTQYYARLIVPSILKDHPCILAVLMFGFERAEYTVQEGNECGGVCGRQLSR